MKFEEFQQLLDTSIKSNYDQILILNTIHGGWEKWFQLEIYLQNIYDGYYTIPEYKIETEVEYPQGIIPYDKYSKRIADFKISDNDTPYYVELKTKNVTEFQKDCDKIRHFNKAYAVLFIPLKIYETDIFFITDNDIATLSKFEETILRDRTYNNCKLSYYLYFNDTTSIYSFPFSTLNKLKDKINIFSIQNGILVAIFSKENPTTDVNME